MDKQKQFYLCFVILNFMTLVKKPPHPPSQFKSLCVRLRLEKRKVLLVPVLLIKIVILIVCINPKFSMQFGQPSKLDNVSGNRIKIYYSVSSFFERAFSY